MPLHLRCVPAYRGVCGERASAVFRAARRLCRRGHFICELMSTPLPFPIIVPSETRSREFDAKLLLAGFLAERGHPVFVGSRIDIHNRIHTLPRGLYLAKDIRSSSRRIFRILTRLGFAIAAWDEEALVFTDPQTYHRRRVDPENLNRIKAFFAWGIENRKLVESAPSYNSTPVFETGNPRIDLLTARCRSVFDDEVAALRARFGAFILINSNFGQINHFLPGAAVTRLPDGSLTNLGAATAPWWEYRLKVFEAFKTMLPALARAFPDRHVVVRPHPSESHQAWLAAAQGLPNVSVVHEGNVYPWLMASVVALHNGCTTGLESYLLDHPVISYQPVAPDGFPAQLPDMVSAPARDLDELFGLVGRIIEGHLPPAFPGDIRARVVERVGELDSALASERIDAVIAAHGAEWLPPRPPLADRLAGRLAAVTRALSKQANANRQGHKNSHEYTAHRFPPTSEAEVVQRLNRLAQVTGRMAGLTVRRVHGNIFCVHR